MDNFSKYEYNYETMTSNFDQFKNDLFEELSITDNPKRELLFQKAWELGHSSGYSEVYLYACDLVDLIRQ